MKYDFNTVIDRRNTNSLKYDFPASRNKPEGVMPLWVADMDFKSPPCILKALEDKVEHGIFGYAETGTQYAKVLEGWFLRRFGWQTEESWLVKTPGIVAAIHIAVKALTDYGDAVIIQQPVYHPFAAAVTSNKRKLIVNELILQGGHYTIDFEDFESKIKSNNVKLFILCSPHNPVGRVWSKAELERLGEICLRRNVRIISDEIHADIVYSGYTHHVLANLRKEFADITITCTSPCKAFNLPGLQIANIFIANEDIRTAFTDEYAACGLSQVGTMGVAACEAAYVGGEQWLEELKLYLAGNFEFLHGYLAHELPQVSMTAAEGTYLAWLDFRKLGLSDEELDNIILHKAKVWLNQGTIFGAGGAGFQRMNIACPRETLASAIEQISKAIKGDVLCKHI